MRREWARVPEWEAESVAGMAISPSKTGQFSKLCSRRCNRCIEAKKTNKRKGWQSKNVWKIAFNSSHLEIHIAHLYAISSHCAFVKGAENSCNKGTCLTSFDLVFPIFIGHRPFLLGSITWKSGLQNVSLENTALREWSDGTSLLFTSWFFHCSPPARSPFPHGFRPT